MIAKNYIRIRLTGLDWKRKKYADLLDHFWFTFFFCVKKCTFIHIFKTQLSSVIQHHAKKNLVQG